MESLVIGQSRCSWHVQVSYWPLSFKSTIEPNTCLSLSLFRTIAKEWGIFGVRANTVAYGFIETRLTANKAAGASITVDGKTIALGVPGGGPKPAGPSPIPLQRPGNADEAAAGILLYVPLLS